MKEHQFTCRLPVVIYECHQQFVDRLSVLCFRYYFKKASDEFECGAVFEEVWDDCTVLPMYEGKILGKVERMD